MHALLLCWRYMQSRYLAFACVISVTLGVSTLVVVNSVIEGFSTDVKERLHALHADIVIECSAFRGFADPRGRMAKVQADPVLNQEVVAMAATMEVFALLQFSFKGKKFTQPVRLIGIDPGERASVGGFCEFLYSPRNRTTPSFELDPLARARHQRNEQRRSWSSNTEVPAPARPGEKPPPDPPPSHPHVAHGAIIGYRLGHYRIRFGSATYREVRLLHPGDDIILTTASGHRLKPIDDRFVVCDYFKTGLSEFDGACVFVPLGHLQKLRGLEDRATDIHLKLRDYAAAPLVLARLRELFADPSFTVQTWEQRQGTLLAAVQIEKGILNILFFLIVAVAGFSVLGIFSMIVNEKTRDIGILKALGASRGGILRIFLAYGMLLGLAGVVLGSLVGLTITVHIDRVERLFARLTGREIFPRDVFCFDRIPTLVRLDSVALVGLGAIAITVLFSVLPAWRAARLHPVTALREK